MEINFLISIPEVPQYMRRSRIYEEAESNANLLAIVGNVERIAEAHQAQTVTKRRGASASRPAGTGRLICPARHGLGWSSHASCKTPAATTRLPCAWKAYRYSRCHHFGYIGLTCMPCTAVQGMLVWRVFCRKCQELAYRRSRQPSAFQSFSLSELQPQAERQVEVQRPGLEDVLHGASVVEVIVQSRFGIQADLVAEHVFDSRTSSG